MKTKNKDSKWGVVVSVRVPDTMITKIDDYLHDSEIYSSRSDIIRLALKLFFERIEKENMRKRHLAEAAQVLNPAAFPGVKR